MSAAGQLADRGPALTEDQVVVLEGATWAPRRIELCGVAVAPAGFALRSARGHRDSGGILAG